MIVWDSLMVGLEPWFRAMNFLRLGVIFWFGFVTNEGLVEHKWHNEFLTSKPNIWGSEGLGFVSNAVMQLRWKNFMAKGASRIQIIYS